MARRIELPSLKPKGMKGPTEKIKLSAKAAIANHPAGSHSSTDQKYQAIGASAALTTRLTMGPPSARLMCIEAGNSGSLAGYSLAPNISHNLTPVIGCPTLRAATECPH